MDIKELSMEQFMGIKDGTYITAAEYSEKYGMLLDRIRKYCQTNQNDSSKCFKVGSVWYLRDRKIDAVRNRNLQNEDMLANKKMRLLYDGKKELMTKTEFARKLGISYATYNAIDANRRAVSLALRKKAIELYNLPEDYFIEE